MDAPSLLQQSFAHFLANRHAEAEAGCRAILDRYPNHPAAVQLLAMLAQAQKRLPVALKLARLAVRLSPGTADFHNTLGAILADLGQTREAAAAFDAAIRLRPEYAEAWRNLGLCLAKNVAATGDGENDRETVHLAPKVLPIGMASYALLRAAELRPDDPRAWEDVLSLGHDVLGADVLIRCLRRRAALRADSPQALSDLLYALHYDPAMTPEVLLEEHLAWGRRFGSGRGDVVGRALPAGESAEGRMPCGVEAVNTPREVPPVVAPAQSKPFADADLGIGMTSYGRRVRVGYLSEAFREHPRARFMTPLLAGHDRSVVEVFGYSDVRRADRCTARIKALCEHWREIPGWSDRAVAEEVAADGIDVLVDSTGHMAGSRLGVMAWRERVGRREVADSETIGTGGTPVSRDTLGTGKMPVVRDTLGTGGTPVSRRPVQVFYPGYPSTTGLAAVDWCLTDALRDPPGAGRWYVEKLWRIGDCARVYDAGEDAPPVAPLPLERGGAVTFGCLNNAIKINPPLVELWARVLAATPGSRLLLLGGNGAAGPAWVRGQLTGHGIDAHRVEWLPRVPRPAYLGYYGRIDIALDTYPYAGHTTTLDAAWMGVPTITRYGETHLTREGFAINRLLGLDELSAATAADYVRIATGLAGDVRRLAALRWRLRERMRGSPLADGEGLARKLEAAFAGMVASRFSASE